MNAFDLVVVVLFVVAVLIGFRSGALPQIAGLVGALGGGVLAIVALPYLEDAALERSNRQLRAFAVLGGMLFLVGIGEAIGSAIGRTAAVRLRRRRLRRRSTASSARVVGGAQALLIVWLIGGLLAAGPSATSPSRPRPRSSSAA